MATREFYEKTRKFILRNARPVDLARFQFHFEQGSREAVIEALAAYQNEDGGFGHALEADSWNPNSSPTQTWMAIGILQEIQLFDPSHPVVAGVLRYLESGQDFNGHVWSIAIPSNNDYPHAPWWHYQGNGKEETDYLPTAGIVGYLLFSTQEGSPLYDLACRVIREAVAAYLPDGSDDMHLVGCYLQLAGACVAAGKTDLIDFQALHQRLQQDVDRCIEHDVSRWQTDYVCKPSNLIFSPDIPFYPQVKDLVDAELRLMEETQMEDGAWAVTWNWGQYSEAFAISAHIWRANLAILNLLFLRNFGRLELS